MTLVEELEEQKTAFRSAMMNNANAGTVLGYTTNGTKMTYEGATKNRQVLKDIKYEIAQTQILISNNARLKSCQ